MMSNYEKNAKLFEKIKGLIKKHNVTFVTAQQPSTKFQGRTRLVHLVPKSTNDVIIIDHVNLIGK